MSARIAIVGIACHYPDAASPAELFDNLLAGRRAFRRIPPERLPLDRYGEREEASYVDNVDRTYLEQASVIEGYAFDRVRFKTVGSTYRSADLTHWLALDVADRALTAAGFEDGRGLPRERTGVVLGNTLAGEFSRASMMRLRWPYVEELLSDALIDIVPDAPARDEFLARFERRYKAPFECFGDESLAGGLANTIAGRICNYFDLGGGGFTVDGACASSLLAVANACTSLETGDLDVALAGGVDLSLDPFELVGFARMGALARDEMRVFDRRSQGFWPGEGCGVLVLMREDDALEQGRDVIACVRGWGVSSDGAGGISRPEKHGQQLAMRRAYRRAGFGLESIGYFEGHGTGTVVGDATELGALGELLASAGRSADRPVVIGSIKANIGHTKAAAGVAGLITAALTLERETIAPMPACEHPNPLADPNEGAPLRIAQCAEDWPAHTALRAGVSSMGFGGINAHIVLDRESSPQSTQVAACSRAARLAHSAQDAELFLFAAASTDELAQQVGALRSVAAQLSHAELRDAAAAQVSALNTVGLEPAPLRAAVVAARPLELAERLTLLESWLAGGADAPHGDHLDLTHGVMLGSGRGPAAIGFLFPGQSAPIYPDLGAIGQRMATGPEHEALRLHAQAAALAERPGGRRTADDVVDTRVAQPAIVSASIATAELLAGLGITAELAIGHSIGEISALQWAGALSVSDATRLAEVRGRILSEHGESGGAMLSLATDEDTAQRLIGALPCTLAAFNGPHRCVTSGPAKAIDQIVERAREECIPATRLAVSHAFHSPEVSACGPPLQAALVDFSFDAPLRSVYSTRTGRLLDPDCDLRDHLVRQVTQPVLFVDAVRRAAEHVSLFIEVGPGRMLGSLMAEFVDTPCISLDAGGPSLREFLIAVGASHALGAQLAHARLFENRGTKPFDVSRPLSFFKSPCAQPLAALASELVPPSPESDVGTDSDGNADEDGRANAEQSALELVNALVARRCELPVAAIQEHDRLLSDLHLTSIAVSELAARAARELGRQPLVAPGEFADATVRELADAIDSDARELDLAKLVPGVSAWVRPFEIIDHVCEAPAASRIAEHKGGGRRWRVYAEPSDAFSRQLCAELEKNAASDGVLVYLSEQASEANLPLLLMAAREAVQGLGARQFVLVHHGDAGVAIARTLHQEANSLSTRIIQIVKPTAQAIEQVLTEVRAASSYLEASYNATGVRRERRLRLLATPSEEPSGTILSGDDVLLISGGGKGIAAECGLALASAQGCALGIVGRSLPADDDALRAHLQRLDGAGVRWFYARADVSDPTAAERAVKAIEEALGPITGLLHGAGVNHPQPLALLKESDFADTLAPKLHGLENLLQGVDPGRLRCVVGFGSILCELGLAGEADYAFANELLTRRIEAFAHSHPQVRCLAIEWSIWSGVGMGERLGRVEALAAQNITAITPEEGVDWLQRLLSVFNASTAEPMPVRIFLSGRFGAPPTLKMLAAEPPIARFLERIREHTPGVELVADSSLSLGQDPYLADHIYAEESILPGVMVLEAMTQVTQALAPGASTLEFENVQFSYPTVVPRDGSCDIRVAALQREAGGIELVLRSESTSFQLNHATAFVRIPADASTHPEAPAAPTGPALALEPSDELYGDLFFHAGRFKRVKRYRALSAFGCSADIVHRVEPFFGAFQPQRLALGDAGARDAALHALQACVPDRGLLPVSAERICVTRLEAVADSCWRLEARERSRGAGRYVYDLWLIDADGHTRESWQGLVLQEVAGQPPRAEWPAALLGPRLEELADLHLAVNDLHVAVVPGADARASERAVSIAGAGATLSRRSDGKPWLSDGRAVSTSHASGHTLAVVAQSDVACDFETVCERPEQVWADMLGPQRRPLARHLVSLHGESAALSNTRIFGAIECLRKLGRARETPISVSSHPNDPIVRLRAGDDCVLSVAARLRAGGDKLVMTLLAEGRYAGL